MRKSGFIKHLNALEEEDLKNELIMLYDKVPGVKAFYAMELGSADQRKKTYRKAKEEIASKYKTKSYRRPRRPRIQKVLKIFSELKKITVLNYELIDVYLFDVETALEFVREYNYFSTPLFNNIIRSYKEALSLISENNMFEEYRERCENVVVDSKVIFELNQEIVNLFNVNYKV